MKKILFRYKKKLIELGKFEPYFFFFFLIINLLPVFCFKFFPTVDGPAHLYNSRLILELLGNSNSPVHDFIHFNQHITPNWSGHIFLTCLLFFLPSFIAEKIVLLIYLLGLPLSIRHLFKTTGITNYYLIYLIFPFTYSYLFYYGFYNFNIGLVVFFFGLSYWSKYHDHFSLINVLILMLISTLICLSHIFVFAIFILVIFILNFGHFKLFFRQNKTERIDTLKCWSLQFLSILPGLLIMIIFLSSGQLFTTTFSYLSFHDIIISLKYIMPSKGINYDGYDITSRILLYVFIILIVYLFSLMIFNLVKKNHFILKNMIWISITGIILLFLFILPDSSVSLGFVSSRLMLLFFLFLIIWLAAQKVSFWLRILIFLVVSFVNISIIIHNIRSVSVGCEIAKEINDLSEVINPYNTVLPINFSDKFPFSHISNYLGSDKPVIILENYEATLDYFPLKWNYNKVDKILQTDFRKVNSIKGLINSGEGPCINYILIIEDKKKEKHIQTGGQPDNIFEMEIIFQYVGKDVTIQLFKNRNCTL
jgi:hypothetical protein